jgi:5-oxoprolinase (ATP-hydrolysing) subunit B
MSFVMSLPRFLPQGDTALTLEFSREIDATVNARVLALNTALRAENIEGLIETVPTYRSLMVQFNPLIFDLNAFHSLVLRLLSSLMLAQEKQRLWHVPVCYARGIDVEFVAATHQLSPQEIIARHSQAVYRVYMVGFLPGFIYLGGLDQSIAMPRRLDPRPALPAGNISIGGIQALIASVTAPSGWHMLGQTPMKTFMKTRDPVFLMQAGDNVRFHAISEQEFLQLEKDAEQGQWVAELET